MIRRTLPVVGASTLFAFALAGEASALLMCGPRAKDGGLREGAPIRVRAVCRANEIELNPTALGLQGPPGSGAIVRDAAGSAIGTLIGTQLLTIGTVVPHGRSVKTVAMYQTGGFQPGGFNLQYATSDCTGDAFAFGFERGSPIAMAAIFGEPPEPPLNVVAGPGTVAFAPSGMPTTITARSTLVFSGSCDSPSLPQPDIAPGACCSAYPNPQATEHLPVVRIDLGNFLAPFRIDAIP